MILEISEQLVQPQLSRIAPALWRLRNLGIRLALDDFGAGQISLTYLKSLPINFLKISREFFWALRGNCCGGEHHALAEHRRALCG